MSAAPAVPLWPAITAPVILDATTQPGYATSPLIELNGASAGSGANGLTINTGNSTVKGFDIGDFSGDGIDLAGTGGNTVVANFIGANPAGAAPLPNGVGINITSPNNIIGGAGAGNVISGNIADGVDITGAANPPGLVSLYNANGNANDSVGSNNGTSVGGVSYAPGVTGHAGDQAFSLDGTSGYVSIPDSPSLDYHHRSHARCLD